MGVSPVYVTLMTGSDGMVRFATDATMVSLEHLAYGYVLYLLGSLALHIGMQVLRPQIKPEATQRFSPHLVWWFVLVWAGGLLFQMRPTLFAGLGSATKILAVALVGSVCGFAVTPRENLKLSRLGFFALLTVGTAGLFFGNLASGSKAYIMFSFLPVTWLFILNPKLRLWTLALGAGLAIFYFAVVAPVVHTSRLRPLETGEDPREHMIESLDIWLRERPEELSQSFFVEQFDQFVNRQFDPVPVGFIVGEVNESGLRMGETMEYATYAFIPRLLWPDKPTVTRGAWFSDYLGLYGTEGEVSTSVGMTAIGELYWNFGMAGVLIGMLAIGCLQGLLWCMAGSDPQGKPIHMLLYVSIMLSMTDMPEAVTVFVSLAITYLTFKAAFMCIALVNRPLRRGTAAVAHPSHAAHLKPQGPMETS
jgi:hypothetical protein